MTKLNIYCLDDIPQQDCIVSLQVGDHIIGRGNLLQVKDKRVSRKHALIQVTEQNITLTSIHENPCFFKAHKGQSVTIIRQNQIHPLEDGDQFALLPHDLWFRVRVEKEALTNENILNGKRPLEDERVDITSKRKKNMETEIKETQPQEETWDFQISEFFEADTPSTSLNNEAEPSTEFETAPEVTLNNKTEPVKEAALQLTPNSEVEPVKESEAALAVKQELKEVVDKAIKIKEEPKSSSQEEPVAIEEKVEPVDVLNIAGGAALSDQNGAQAENGQQQPKKTYRDRCWYGERCFRRNPNHREQFSHPGDPDYQSDPEDDRPMCPYGVTCYRVNPEHRRDYKHLGKPAPKPSPGQPSASPEPFPANNPPATKKKRSPKKKPKKDQSFDSEDDYDYDDPFLNDDSEDDYQPTDSDGISDEDFHDSQDAKQCSEEESQARRRMLREAEKFLKGDKEKKSDDVEDD